MVDCPGHVTTTLADDSVPYKATNRESATCLKMSVPVNHEAKVMDRHAYNTVTHSCMSFGAHGHCSNLGLFDSHGL